MFRSNVLVCGGTGCTSSNSEKIIEKLHEEINAKGLEKEVNVVRTGCFGLCALGPIMIVYPEGAFYSMVTPEDVPEIVEEHLLKGRIVKRLLYKETVVDDTTTKSLNETQFYEKQMRVALRNCGVINPEVIDEYIALDGYQAVGKILTEKIPPEQVIQTMLDSGLRGRGGAGFPTGLKWKFAAANQADQKYVCCNADEGDPGAFMDRSILEGDPHSIIEAMTIAGYAIGATQGYVYIRAEYPIAVKRLQIAIDQAREYGLLGKNIFDSGFDFDIELRLGAGAFVCGEETALMTSIEGKRGEPRCRPPFPALKGLFQKPTVLNNVETYANIPQIFLKGPAVVPQHRHREEPRHQGVRARRQDPQHGPCRGPDGHHAARGRRRHRRRHPGRPQVQGRADRRPVRRLHPGVAHRHADRLRLADRHRLHDGLRRPDRHGRDDLHGRHREVLPRVHG